MNFPNWGLTIWDFWYGKARTTRSIRTRAWQIITGSSAEASWAGFPGIIVEHAFVNNPSDCKKYFSSDAAIKKLGVADATAISKYYGLKLKTDTPDPKPDPDPNPTPSGTEGWKEENGHYYYQRSDGSRAASGWLKLEEGIYYLDENGYRTEGFVKVGEKTYYQEKGTGKRLTGFQTIQKKLYYFRPSTGSMLHFGWVSINGKRYYFHEDGHAQKDWQRSTENVISSVRMVP